MEKSGNKISVSGIMLIVFSFLFASFVQYRPNRVLSGTNLFARDLFGNTLIIFIFLSILLFFFLIVNPKKYIYFTIFLIFLLTGIVFYTFGKVTENEFFFPLPTGRISIGGGFWLLILGIYMVINGSFKEFKEGVLYRRICYLGIFLMIAIFLMSGHLNNLSIIKEFFNRSTTFYNQVSRHFSLSFLSVLAGIFIGIPSGIFIFRSKKTNHPLLYLINLGQTIPTLSLLGLIMLPLTFLGERSEFLKNIGIRGVGFTPAFIVLVVYALFPIIHNTIAGLKLVDENLLEIASSMGMKKNQIFWKVQLPLSLPVIMGGIRTAMTQSIGNTILAGLIGGGGLGSIIFLGLAQAAPDLILLGIIPLIIMAFILDSFFSFFIIFYKRKYAGVLS